MFKLVFTIVVLISQFSTASEQKEIKNSRSPNNNIFVGISNPIPKAGAIAIIIVGSNYDSDLEKEAISNGKSKCYLIYNYCSALIDTFETKEKSDGSVYGTILVRGYNNLNEVEELKQDPRNEYNSSTEKVCVFVPHKFINWFDEPQTYYGYYIYDPLSNTKSEEAPADELGKIGVSPNTINYYFKKFKSKGYCETFQIDTEN